jgi:hypothetical protein
VRLSRPRRLRRLTVCGLTAGALAVSGCSSSRTDSASDTTTPPTPGACRDLRANSIEDPSNDSAVITCSKAHTAETFLVGELPASTGASYADKRHGGYVYDACTKAFGAYLGADESMVLRSQLSWAWFRASKRGWERGARWFRCDVVGGPDGATEFRDLPTTTGGMFSTDIPDAWMTCAVGDQVDATDKVPCSAAHDWRAVTSVKIGQPNDAYPGDRIVEVRSREYCKDSIRGWLGYPPDFGYSYTWFKQDRWDTGNRRAICWSRTTR